MYAPRTSSQTSSLWRITPSWSKTTASITASGRPGRRRRAARCARPRPMATVGTAAPHGHRRIRARRSLSCELLREQAAGKAVPGELGVVEEGLERLSDAWQAGRFLLESPEPFGQLGAALGRVELV